MKNITEQLSTLLLDKKMKLVTAESCTGGALSAAITALPGASNIFERGLITYSNEAKIELLNVPKETIKTHGAVSAQTAESMALGALENSHADIAASITGIAGPGGGTEEKPVGTVYFGVALKNQPPQSHCREFSGTRSEVQSQSVEMAIEYLIIALGENHE